VKAVPLLRWAELTNIILNMGFGTPTDGPHCLVVDRRTPIARGEMTVKRWACWGKNVKAHTTRNHLIHDEVPMSFFDFVTDHTTSMTNSQISS
jgi:hypothetical protein